MLITKMILKTEVSGITNIFFSYFENFPVRILARTVANLTEGFHEFLQSLHESTVTVLLLCNCTLQHPF
jgi:hypothetical protein